MSSSRPSRIQRQLGASASGMLMLLIILILLLKVVVALLPTYYDHYMAEKIAKQLLIDVQSQDISAEKLCSSLGTRFDINHVTAPLDHFQCSRDDSGYAINEDYEVRKNFMGNLDVVMHFSHRLENHAGAASH